ncbi:MAG TPA: ABC-F family ATP-binding cassette domain-containing protein [Anaerolineaceae bacterium]|nr:ABC-F family ATP-binding cassette domain-containing protein [Anaerolineaceae bacterium]HPN50382.1 ABC-F family ATP-binding cassette domain-containing protein [Anaerolineaceae bacterium]
MISISLNHVSLTLGARTIFSDLQWEIQHDQKIGLIGPNGAGKSSLFKLIMGLLNPEPGGSVVRMRNVTVGYLAQEPELDPGQTLLEAAMSGSQQMAEVTAELARVEASLGDPEVYGSEKRLSRALERQQALLEQYQALGGDQYPQRVRALLSGLGLAPGDFDKPLAVLSGGQRKLAGLARLILAAPDVLLLDEPDNHLDLAAKGYLEQLIQAYPGAVVIISHDRYLLDAVVTQIAELEDGRLSVFEGDYSTFALAKQERLARQNELYQVQQRQIARIEAAIKRYAIWAKTYDNQKFAKRAHAIQNRLDKMDRVERPVLERRRMELRLNGWRGSTKVLELRGLRKAYGPRVILQPTDWVLRHGQRVGIIGKNGGGKSVLMRMLLGLETPDGGEVILGPSITTAYYAQQHETLNLDQTVLDTVRLVGNMSESNAVSFLNRFLFPYRQVLQRVGELSGGERSRLQLALVVLSGANFLLLDEPTNNLDIASAEVLEAALADFEGTVLVISHDRYFLDQVVERVLLLDDGRLVEYEGGYSDYLAAAAKP